ncbi:uncharacterized protein LOC131625662 [Vicia villosa]|uniref:uncharacterized protein LOC131625662 n=1 Tax=Vicia villosa TaxID=3911 RepID=UPI00273C9C0E|nr:uncharacterized protein LOC131625662 [Vicia villosa]
MRFRLALSSNFQIDAVMSSEKEALSSKEKRRLSCTAHFDALWFCYFCVFNVCSPSSIHQMQQYYRLGVLDNCSGKWKAMVDCLMLKTKPTSQLQEILEAQEKSNPHIWNFRTRYEASKYWQERYGHLDRPE